MMGRMLEGRAQEDRSWYASSRYGRIYWEDSDGLNVFEGGFMGLDNISVYNRSRPLLEGYALKQADSTGWMAMFALTSSAGMKGGSGRPFTRTAHSRGTGTGRTSPCSMNTSTRRLAEALALPIRPDGRA